MESARVLRRRGAKGGRGRTRVSESCGELEHGSPRSRRRWRRSVDSLFFATFACFFALFAVKSFLAVNSAEAQGARSKAFNRKGRKGTRRSRRKPEALFLEKAAEGCLCEPCQLRSCRRRSGRRVGRKPGPGRRLSQVLRGFRCCAARACRRACRRAGSRWRATMADIR